MKNGKFGFGIIGCGNIAGATSVRLKQTRSGTSRSLRHRRTKGRKFGTTAASPTSIKTTLI